jgi:hypothetical protein
LVATVVQIRQFVPEHLTVCGRGIAAIEQLIGLASDDEVVLVRSFDLFAAQRDNRCDPSQP